MPLLELQRPPLEGALNVQTLVGAIGQPVLLRRDPKHNPHILDSIGHEYDFLGFSELGGKFRRRSAQEQIDFCRYSFSQGLRVLPPYDVDHKGRGLYPYLNQAKTLDEFLPFAKEKEINLITTQLFSDLWRAHQRGIVYGDRWSKNMLVVPRRGLVHIDFDIEISGKPARELEVAQAAYYSLCGGKEKSIPVLAHMLAKGKGWFDLTVVERFLMQHALHFQQNPQYGGMVRETDMLITEAHRQQQRGFSR